MSRGACSTLAAAMTAAAVGFVLIGRTLGPTLPAGAWPFYVLAGLCAVVSLACLAPGSRPVTLRIVGTAVFLSYAFYAYDSLAERGYGRALGGFIVWGLPAGYVAVRGTYPRWGRAAAAFGAGGGSPTTADSSDPDRPVLLGSPAETSRQ